MTAVHTCTVCAPSKRNSTASFHVETPPIPLVGLPISGIGGVSTWKDAVEFLLLGAQTVQVCTAVMHYGFRIVEDLCDGLDAWLDEKGYRSVREITGLRWPRGPKWEKVDSH